MRTRYYLNITITFLLLALLCSCHRRHDVPLHPALQHAESLMQQHPDSALALLSRFNSRSFKDRYQQEAYRVLLVQANDRCYQPIVLYKKDMANAVSYFDSIGDVPAMQSKAHYYLGRIYQDSGNDAGTAKEFLMALPCAKAMKDTFLLCSINSNLGFLYCKNGLLDEAESMYKEAIILEKLQHDNEGLAISYNKLADIMMQKKHPDLGAAKSYLDKSLYYISKSDNKEIRCSIYASLTILYQSLHQPEMVLKYADLGLDISTDPSNGDGFYFSKGVSYLETSRYDSAYICLTKSLAISQNLYTKANAYKILSRLMEKRGDLQRSIYYHQLYDQYNDSIMINSSNSDVVKAIQSAERKQIATENQSRKYHLYCFSAVVLLIFLFLVIFIIVYRLRSMKKRNILIRKKNIIESEKKHTEELLEAQKEITIQKENEIINIIRIHSKDDIMLSPIYKRICQILNNNASGGNSQLSTNDWAQIIEKINETFYGIVDYLLSEYQNLTGADLNLICLFILDFPIKDIKFILNCSSQNVYKRKHALFKRLHIDNESDIIFFLTDVLNILKDIH